MPIHALIFDLDGTLVDSLTDIGETLNAALELHGLPTHRLDAYRHMVGEGVEVLVTRAMPREAVVPMRTVLDSYRGLYRDREYAKTWAYPGIEQLLVELTKRKVPMAVLSNKRDDFTKALVARRFGAVPFATVRGEQDGSARKPDPKAAFEVALALNVPAADVGFVGDTAVDMKTARGAGMHAIGVLWGFRDRAEIEGAGAHHVLSQPHELLSLLP